MPAIKSVLCFHSSLSRDSSDKKKKTISARQSLEMGIDSNRFFSFSERLSRKLDRMKLNEK